MAQIIPDPLSKVNAVKENVNYSDQIEFLQIFCYSELLIWMLPAPNVTDHSYLNSVHLKIFTVLSLPMYCRLENFFYAAKNCQICNT